MGSSRLLIPFALYMVHSSLTLRGFVLCGFANPRASPQNKNLSFCPFSLWEYRNCSTRRTGLRNIPHDVQGVDGRSRWDTSSFQQSVSANRNKTLKYCFFGAAVNHPRIFTLRGGVGSWTLSPRRSRDECVKSALLLYFIIIIIIIIRYGCLLSQAFSSRYFS